jgi:hypothetical protein
MTHRDFQFCLPVERCFNLRFWCIKWRWKVFIITNTSINRHVKRNIYSAKIPILCYLGNTQRPA